MTQRSDVVAIDVGNSAVKAAIRQSSDNELAGETFLLKNTQWMRPLCDWLQSNLGGRSPECWVSTVNRSASVPLKDHLSELFPGASWTDVRFDMLPIRIDVDFPDRVGIDRLVGGFAASKRFKQPVVVVDAGSAVTVDYIDHCAQEDGLPHTVFSGGAILPGVRLQLAALAQGTEGIEQVTLDPPESSNSGSGETRFRPGKNTDAAIRLGVVSGLVGSVQRLAADYSFETDASKVKMVLTGGDAFLLSSYLSMPHLVVPNLVCDGLFQLATELE